MGFQADVYEEMLIGWHAQTGHGLRPACLPTHARHFFRLTVPALMPYCKQAIVNEVLSLVL